jgi:hypothetical protein
VPAKGEGKRERRRKRKKRNAAQKAKRAKEEEGLSAARQAQLKRVRWSHSPSGI